MREEIPQEEKLINPKKTIEVIQKYGFLFRKNFGQNFLIDAHVAEKIMRAAEITPEDEVLEVGPGIGTLTQYLAESAGHVTAVEIDDRLLPVLADTLSPYRNVRVVQGDILKTDLDQLFPDRVFKCVANLPYYITTPVIMELLEKNRKVQSLTVMVQREVAERMKAEPGTKEYGSLSLAVQYYAEPYLAANVPPNCFMPRPNVGSAVIRLTKREKPPVEVRSEKRMFQLIHAAFQQRRKTLVNAIRNSADFSLTGEEAAQLLTDCGLDPKVRGEALGLDEFAAISDRISEKDQVNQT